MDGRNPVETRSKTPAHDIAQRCRLQPRQPNTRYSPPLSWKSSLYLNPRPRRGTASNGPFERPIPYLMIAKNEGEKKQSMCPKSLEYTSYIEKNWDLDQILCSSASCVQIENWQGQSTALYKTFTFCVVMPPLWFCSLAERRAVSRRGTGGTMGSQWHSRIRWRSQLRRHTSLAVTPLGWHLATHFKKQISVVIKLLEIFAKQHPASPGCRRHWASMSERQIALEASPQIKCHYCWFLQTVTL